MRILSGHMRKGINNTTLNLFATNLIVNRTNFSMLDNNSPRRALRECNTSIFSITASQQRQFIENMKVIVGRLLVQFCPAFNFLSNPNVIPKHIKHKYWDEMQKPSLIIPCPLLDANEQKYEDCVIILRALEEWIYEIYRKARKVDERPVPQHPDLPSAHANAGQTFAHSIGTADDPMKDIRVHLSGDQLTRVRAAGTKDILAGAHTPTDRFEHCSPFKPVMFHTRASLLNYGYNLLFDSSSVNQVGTLKYFREKYNRKSSTPDDVMKCFEGSIELFESVGKAYIVTAFLHFFGMEKVDDLPTKHRIPQSPMTRQQKLEYFDNVEGEFVRTFISQIGQASEEEDNVKNYGLSFIYLTVMLLQLEDTAREGDGERNLMNQKLLIPLFKSLGSYSKYAIEMFIAVSQVEITATKRMSEELKWGYFTSWRGGVAKNIEEDMAQEIYNRITKEIVKRMGANKSMSSISNISRAVGGIKTIKDSFDESIELPPDSSKHHTADSKNDELGMIQDLMGLKPFEHQNGRAHDSFQNIKRHPLLNLNMNEYGNWLKDQMERLVF